MTRLTCGWMKLEPESYIKAMQATYIHQEHQKTMIDMEARVRIDLSEKPVTEGVDQVLDA
jgi:hypothetical protein